MKKRKSNKVLKAAKQRLEEKIDLILCDDKVCITIPIKTQMV